MSVPHSISVPLCLLALLVPAVSAAGMSANDAGVPPIFNSVSAPAPAKPAAANKTVVKSQVRSPEIAAALASEIPKYDPPKPEKTAVADAGKPNAPKNQTPRLPAVRLPTYVVGQSRYRELDDRDVDTEKVFTDLQVKHYLSEFDYAFLNRFTLPLFGTASKESRAMDDYENDEWKEAWGEENGFAKLENTGK